MHNFWVVMSWILKSLHAHELCWHIDVLLLSSYVMDHNTFFPFLLQVLAKILWNLLTLISSTISAELDKLLEDAPLPFIMQHAAKISGVRKRVSSLNSLLKSIQHRVDNIDRMLSMGLAHGIHFPCIGCLVFQSHVVIVAEFLLIDITI